MVTTIYYLWNFDSIIMDGDIIYKIYRLNGYILFLLR